MTTKRKTAALLPANQGKLKLLWATETYVQLIDKLPVDGEYKEMLKTVLALTVKSGKRIIEIGKEIIEIIVWALKKHPKPAAVLVIGTILALIATHIPPIGVVLGPIIAAVTIVLVSAIYCSEAVKAHIGKVFITLT
jgi:hypothetical protein